MFIIRLHVIRFQQLRYKRYERSFCMQKVWRSNLARDWPISIKHTNQQIVRQQFKCHVPLLMTLKQMFCVTVSVASSCLIIEKRNWYLISKNLQYQISTITYIYTWIICDSKLQFKSSSLPLFNNPLRSQMARNCWIIYFLKTVTWKPQ